MYLCYVLNNKKGLRLKMIYWYSLTNLKLLYKALLVQNYANKSWYEILYIRIDMEQINIKHVKVHIAKGEYIFVFPYYWLHVRDQLSFHRFKDLFRNEDTIFEMQWLIEILFLGAVPIINPKFLESMFFLFTIKICR